MLLLAAVSCFRCSGNREWNKRCGWTDPGLLQCTVLVLAWWTEKYKPDVNIIPTDAIWFPALVSKEPEGKWLVNKTTTTELAIKTKQNRI